MRMSIEAYDTLHKKLFPLPIPEQRPSTINGELHYMSLEDSMPLRFTDEHQPSKKSRTTAPLPSTLVDVSVRGRGRGGSMGEVPAQAEVEDQELPRGFHLKLQQLKRWRKWKNISLGHTTRTRGLLHCLECKKPRCIYSMNAISEMQPSGSCRTEEQMDCMYMFLAFSTFSLKN